jgi:hypothetical protein
MKRPWQLDFDTQEHDYRASNLLLLRDPSLRASAQDDSQSFVDGGIRRRLRRLLIPSLFLAPGCHPERRDFKQNP